MGHRARKIGGYYMADEDIIAMMSRHDIMKDALKEIADACPCTCDPAYYKRSLVAPDCLADLAGDMAREALGLPIECRGALAPPSEAQKRMAAKIQRILEMKQ